VIAIDHRRIAFKNDTRQTHVCYYYIIIIIINVFLFIFFSFSTRCATLILNYLFPSAATVASSLSGKSAANFSPPPPLQFDDADAARRTGDTIISLLYYTVYVRGEQVFLTQQIIFY